jgi:3-oxoacyl-[acyl-carrier protein] reductase
VTGAPDVDRGTTSRRVALVTGGAQGLGAAIARRLSSDGAHVVVADRDETGARRTAHEIDGDAAAVDVRDWDAMRALVDDVTARHGAIDVLVNNAARSVSRSFWEIERDEWDDVLAVNLGGTFAGCRAVAEHMRDRGAGRIVNVSSIAGQQGGINGGAHYAASKAAIIVLTKIVAAELAPYGVTVNAIAPAAVESPVLDALPAERRAAIAASLPVGRIGRADEVAAAVAYLVSDEAGFVTGATLDVNGGMLMR